MKRFIFFKHSMQLIYKICGIPLFMAALFVASSAGAQTSPADTPFSLEQGLARPYPAPDFSGIKGWINSPPLTMAQLKGKVVLIDFWTYSCINCIRTLSHIKTWDQKYRDQGLVIIGVHAPEFEFEKSSDNIRRAVTEHNLQYPVAIDSDLSTWKHYHNLYWPAHYLIDRSGMVVYTHFGEGDYDITENNIRYLLGLKTPMAQNNTPEILPISAGQTPETYLGYTRAQSYGGGDYLTRDTAATYHLPPSLALNGWALSGAWNVSGEKITTENAGAVLQLHFNARKVFLVLGSRDGKPITAHLTLNGQQPAAMAGKDAPDGKLTVDHDALYELLDQQSLQAGQLQILADAPGLEAYAFTFGN